MSQHRFTLIELLVVLVIFVILAGMTFGVMRMVWQRNAQTVTISRMGQIDAAMEGYQKKHGYFLQNPPPATPPDYSVDSCRMTASEMRVLGLDLPLVGGYVVDYWKQPIHFRCPGVMNPQRYDLWSKGPDKRTGNGNPDVRQALTRGDNDDITNWRGR